MRAFYAVLTVLVRMNVSGKPEPIHSLLLNTKTTTRTTPTITPPPVRTSTVPSIISQSNNINTDESFSFGYETENGIKVDESGFLKPNPNAKTGSENTVIQVLTGTYSYTATDGTQINLKLLADENGFQPVGDYIPTSPPIPKDRQNVAI